MYGQIISIRLSLLATIVLVLTGCSPSSSQDAGALTLASKLTETQARQKARAIEAQTHLLRALQKELQQAISDPAEAISVCKKRGDSLARSIGQEMGVRIGRTSTKIRNLNNVPPLWAKALVDEKHEHEMVVALPNNGLGFLSPIMTKSICINCHGEENQIEADVFAEILSAYPDDAAIGFAVGEVRGYVWVEVPPVEQQK